MKAEIYKPNKSSPYFRLTFYDPLGYSVNHDGPLIKKYNEMATAVTVYLTKKEIKTLGALINSPNFKKPIKPLLG